MTDYPIIMSAPMVRALLEGRKTQDRRLAWWEKRCPGCYGVGCVYCTEKGFTLAPTIWQKVRPGDRLWVKETWCCSDWDKQQQFAGGCLYAADGNLLEYHIRRPSIHMPRWASRLTLTVTETRKQMVEDVSWDDAIAEGVVDTGRRDGEPWPHCEVPGIMPPIREAEADLCFKILWEQMHGFGNPEVVAMTFTVALENIGPKEVAA